MTKKYKDVDIEAVACVHNLQYSSVQYKIRNIELYLKVDFLGTVWVYKRPTTGTGKETHMDIPVF